MIRLAVVIAALALAGCNNPFAAQPICYEVPANEAQVQANLIQCLNSVPAGPQATKYNDWAEVVEACQQAARSNVETKRVCI